MSKPLVGIVMGSESDYETMKHAEEILIDFGVPYEISVTSAHRTPQVMYDYARGSQARGLKVIIAGAGGAAHLPGMVSSLTTLPVLGVPVESKSLKGMDSLLSIVQMPGGIPTATFAIGTAGATNAGIFAVEILALTDEKLRSELVSFRKKREELALKGNKVVQARLKTTEKDSFPNGRRTAPSLQAGNKGGANNGAKKAGTSKVVRATKRAPEKNR